MDGQAARSPGRRGGRRAGGHGPGDARGASTAEAPASPAEVIPFEPPRRRGLRRLFHWAGNSWAVRSTAVGGVATVLDVAVLLVCVKLFHTSNPVGAGIGVFVGAVFTFFANRHFAFRDHHPELGPQALKFAITTGFAIALHMSLVHVMADLWHVPVVLAKLAADLLVFSVGQLLLLRYVVFPKKKPAPDPEMRPGP